MRDINLYIIEKLHLNKDIQITNKTFIGIFGLTDNKKGLSFKEFDTEEKLKKYVIKCKNDGTIKKRDLLCYECPTALKIDLLDMCFKSYNDEFGWSFLNNWCEKNNIRYIFRNDILTEKLHLNKDTKVFSITEELSDIIKDYCQNTLKLKTQQYVSHCENDKGESTFNEPDKLSRIYLWSKNFKNIDKVADELAIRLNKVKRIKKTEVFVTAIYFYFE